MTSKVTKRKHVRSVITCTYRRYHVYDSTICTKIPYLHLLVGFVPATPCRQSPSHFQRGICHGRHRPTTVPSRHKRWIWHEIPQGASRWHMFRVRRVDRNFPSRKIPRHNLSAAHEGCVIFNVSFIAWMISWMMVGSGEKIDLRRTRRASPRRPGCRSSRNIWRDGPCFVAPPPSSYHVNCPRSIIFSPSNHSAFVFQGRCEWQANIEGRLPHGHIDIQGRARAEFDKRHRCPGRR